MSGADFLLDSNVLIGLVNGYPQRSNCSNNVKPHRNAAPSAASPAWNSWVGGITPQQEVAITELPAGMVHLPITEAVENATIRLRRTRKIKHP